MSKKEMQAFMKAKLAKTKIQDSAVSQASATGPQLKNFNKPPKKEEPEKSVKQYIPRVAQAKQPNAKSTAPKQHPVQLDIPTDEDEIAAANAAMMNNQNYNVNKGSKQLISQSSSKGGGGYEERKTVVNTSKNIYKPSFNLPTKDPIVDPSFKKNKTNMTQRVTQKTPL